MTDLHCHKDFWTCVAGDFITNACMLFLPVYLQLHHAKLECQALFVWMCISTLSFTNWILLLYYVEKLVSVNQFVLCYVYLHTLYCSAWWSKCSTSHITNSRCLNHTISSLISLGCILVKRLLRPSHIILHKLLSFFLIFSSPCHS